MTKSVGVHEANPDLHRDPFDRLLISQARALEVTLITGDETLVAYPIESLLV